MRILRYQTKPNYIPASNYASLCDEMDRLFDVAFPSLGSIQSASPVTLPPVDLYQQKDAFIVRAELPGFRKEDVTVEVTDGVLTLTGHQKADEKEKEAGSATKERKVSRAISLPENLQFDKIHAAYENGVLTVTLPKSEEVKPRQIAVEVK